MEVGKIFQVRQISHDTGPPVWPVLNACCRDDADS